MDLPFKFRLNENSNSWHVGICSSFVLTMLSFAFFLWAKSQVLPGWDAPVTFDGMYYQSIFEHGYAFAGDIEQKGNTAFLPLMAGLIGMASLLPGSNVFVEVLVLGVFVLFATLLGIHLLASQLSDQRAGFVASLLWAFSPMALFNFVGYSEPVFAMLTVWVLLALRGGRLWWAVLLAGISMLARPIGFVLAICVLANIVWRHKDKPREIFAGPVIGQVALLFLPIMSFATWAALHFGDSLVYVNSVEAWRRGSIFDGNYWVWPALRYFFDALAHNAPDITPWLAMLTMLSLGVIAWTLMLARKTESWLVALYVLFLMFTFATSSLDVMNIARHSFYIVPWVVIVGIAVTRWRPVHWASWTGLLLWMVVSGFIQMAAVDRYYRGEWVS